MFVINTVHVSGNLTRDPESIADGKGCKFGIAVNERVKKGDDWEDYPNYFDVTAWASLAEQITKQLSKGSPVAIKGRLRHERWEKDGQKNSRVTITAEAFFAPKQSDGARFNPESDVPPDTADLGPQATPDDEIPF